MNDQNERRDPLEELAAEFTERLRCGENPSIPDYAAAHPGLADEILDLFPTIVSMERLKVQKEASSDGRASLGAVRLERLGDFRIIREIGRGGMGIVFEAEQESLGRSVAIKVLPQHSLLDPDHLRRFRQEAQIAAGLLHTNIVPVFGVGEHEGFHYIVMQLIPGVGLDKIIARLVSGTPDEEMGADGEDSAETGPHDAGAGLFMRHMRFVGNRLRPIGAPYWKSVARAGLQAARALQYAHSRDTLHRDIKPANLLVDGSGTVWVTDFGVAKVMQDNDVTRTGDVVGTLRYMAPERFHGRTDARSDIYSLGLTLYELLTLKPAFDAKDQSSLILHITQDEPAAPRKTDPGIPRDLDTIVLKAIARNPEHRYRSAGALADDLESFLDDMPIQARPITSIERFFRWCRRNPVVAGLASAVSFLLLLTAVVALVGYLQTREASILATKALKGEKDQRRKAESTSLLALEVLDRIYAQFAPKGFSASMESTVGPGGSDDVEIQIHPVVSRETAVLLESLLVFYDRLAEQGSGKVTLRQEAAVAYQRVGSIHRHLGHFDLARDAYRQALEMELALEEDGFSDKKSKRKIALLHNELGTISRLESRPDEAYESHRKALVLLESTLTDCPDDPNILFDLARTRFLLGSQSRFDLRSITHAPPPGRNPGEADPNRREHQGPGRPRRSPPPGERRRPPPDAGRPDGPPWQRGDRPAGENDPRQDRERLMRERAETHLLAAIALLKELQSGDHAVTAYGHLLACCYRELSSLLGFSSAAISHLSAAIEILEDLTGAMPDDPAFRFDLALTLGVWDVRRVSASLLPEAETNLEKALAILEELEAEYPNVPSYAMSHVQMLHKIGGVYKRSRRGDVEPVLRQATEIQSSLVRRYPGVLAYKVWDAEILFALGRSLADQGEHGEARAVAERGVAILEGISDDGTMRPPLPPVLANGYIRLAEIVGDAGDEEAAVELMDRAHDLLEGWDARKHLP